VGSGWHRGLAITPKTPAMPVITTIEDLRVLADKRVPRMFCDDADPGS
jgi:hypothetical protein